MSNKETLEGAAERHYVNCIPSDRHSFISGAKWQAERMYSEEEVLAFGEFCVVKIADFLDGKGDQTDGQEYSMEELFEQFKKK